MSARLLTRIVAAAALAAGCAEERGPRWVELARAEVRGRLPSGAVQLPGGGRARYELVQDELWLVTTLAAADWTAHGEGRFTASLPVIAVGHSSVAKAPYRLAAGERNFVYEADPARFDPAHFDAQPGTFTTDVLALELALAPEESLPEACELAAVIDHARASGGQLRFVGRRQSGAGFWVPAGEPRRVALEIPPASVLCLGLALEPLLGARAGRTAEHVFRVELDGALVFEAKLAGDVLGENAAWHEVALPPGGVRKAELTFSVEGPPALTTIVDALVAPRERGKPGARPWGVTRPDLVVFLADTFRADNLGAYGSTLGLTPQIDRFAAQARVFARAWSTSSHTLPTHATLFTGHFPHQNGLVDFFNPLPGALETLAEKLAASGYRCAAVTDGVMVSQRHGLEQGFASFDERVEVDTLARARAVLASDDGRPLFLFVQSYAVHAPYRPTEETRARLRASLPVDGDFEALEAEAIARGMMKGAGRAGAELERERELARQLRGLYLAEVSELDGLFGRFLGELEQRGGMDAATLVFLADHGESFLEHASLFHASGVYEEELRVPLVVRGPRFAPGREERAVSLIDFLPTVAELTGLAPDPAWSGHSLLAPPAQRMLLGFQARRHPEGAALAVIEGEVKRIARYWVERGEVGEFQARYDLARDPREELDLLARDGGARTPEGELKERLERTLVPLVTPEESALDAEDRRAMEHMGYGGDAPR